MLQMRAFSNSKSTYRVADGPTFVFSPKNRNEKARKHRKDPAKQSGRIEVRPLWSLMSEAYGVTRPEARPPGTLQEQLFPT